MEFKAFVPATEPAKQDNLTESTWEEFSAAGLFWWVNRALHLFGWALVRECEGTGFDAKIYRVYPARCRYRGFPADVEADGFVRLTNHLQENIGRLSEDVKE